MPGKSIIRNSNELGERLWSLKNQEIFCDASILIDGQRIPIHANVLSCYSQFFKSAFEDTKISPKEVAFTDVDVNATKSLIEYCYKGVLDINEKNVMEVFQIASFLEMSSIVENCAEVLKETLNSENCLSIWKTCKIGDNEALINHIIKFIKKNIEEVSNSEEYLSLDFSDVHRLFSCRAKAKSEISLYEALKLWINHEKNRKEHLNKLLEYIEIKNLPINFFTESQSICDSNSLCLTKFFEATTLQQNEVLDNYLNTLIVIGNFVANDSDKIEIYQLKLKVWSKIKLTNCKREEFSTVLMEEKLMIIGGLFQGEALKTVEYYDLKTGQSEQLSQLNCARNQTSAVVYMNNVYVFGGKDKRNLSSVEKWSPRTRTWQEVAPMPTSRNGMRTSVLDDEIFVVGGENDSSLSTTEAYNPITNTWRSCSNMNQTREIPGLATVNGFLYAVGGHNEENSKTAEKYDKTIDKWTMIHSLAIEKRAIAAGNLNGKLVITGGYNSSPKVEAYDEKKDDWTTLSPLNFGRSHHCVVQVPWPLAKMALARKY